MYTRLLFALILYCYGTNFHTLASLNSMYLLSQSSSRSEVQAQLSWVLCLGFHEAAIKMLAGAGILFQAHWFSAKFIPLKV